MDNAFSRQYVANAPREIQDLIYDGQKITAIKMVRQQTGSGLKEAKDQVDALEAQMRSSFPGALPEPKSGGCGTAVLAMVVMLTVAISVTLKVIR